MGFFSSSRKTTELESDNYHVMTAMIETAGGPVVGGGMGEKSVVKVIRSRFVSFAFFLLAKYLFPPPLIPVTPPFPFPFSPLFSFSFPVIFLNQKS